MNAPAPPTLFRHNGMLIAARSLSEAKDFCATVFGGTRQELNGGTVRALTDAEMDQPRTFSRDEWDDEAWYRSLFPDNPTAGQSTYRDVVVAAAAHEDEIPFLFSLFE